MRELSRKHNIWVALILGVLLLLISLSLEPNLDYVYFRGLRAVVAFSFLILLLITRKEGQSYLVLLFMFLHGLSSLGTIWYENDQIAACAMSLNGIAFASLILVIRPKIKASKLDRVILIALICSAIVVGWLSISFIQILGGYIDYPPLFVAIAIITLINFVLAIYAFVYLNTANTGSSVLFIFFLILISFAETFRGIGYYQIVDSELGQYMARLLLIGSFVFIYFFGQYVNRDGRIQ